MTLRRLRWARRGVAALVVADLLALAGASLTRTTDLTTVSSQVQDPRAGVLAPGPEGAPAARQPSALRPVGAAPVQPDAVAAPGPRPTSTPSSTTPPLTPAPPTPAAPVAPVAPGRPAPVAPGAAARVGCPLPLSSPTSNGGLQSLIELAPAFGPFTAEAFAAAAAYAPVLSLVGPLLARYPALAPELAPLVVPLVEVTQLVLEEGHAAVGPLYSPYREQLVAAETALAAALAPYSQALAASALASCLVDLQHTLLSVAR